VDLGSVAVIALIAGLAGGAVGAAAVGTVEGMIRQRQRRPDRGWRQGSRYEAVLQSTKTRTMMAFGGLDPDAQKVVTLAQQEAIQNGHAYVGSENLAMALRLYSTPALARIWSGLAIDADALRRRIEATVPPILGPAPVESNFTPRISRIVAIAGTLAAERKQQLVSPELLLVALADEGGGTGAQALASLGATAQRIREIVDGPKS
jgi:Clp amino terminal domain, pathogenicity island component